MNANASSPSSSTYEAVIVPALHRIQHEYGYLDRAALVAFSKQSSIPLYRLQAVASFFPHFRMTPPPPVTVRVCRDMACNMNGAKQIMADLATTGALVEGASCLGRCDRAPAVCVSIHQTNGHAGGEHGGDGKAPAAATHDSGGAHAHGASEQEVFYLGRSPADLKRVVQQCLAQATQPTAVKGVRGAALPRADRDADLPYKAADWVIDAYKGEKPTYAAVAKAAELRAKSLDEAVTVLRDQQKWTRRRAEQFRLAAESRLQVDFPVDGELEAAVRAWQMQKDWADSPALGGWADALLKELDDAHADLRGMGGAGIPATTKWRDVRDAVRQARARKQDERAFIVVNGDESEPGTFKDREILLKAPHTVIEGVILAGLITDATQGFIYIRHEYPEAIEACRVAIKEAERLGACGPNAGMLGRSFPVSVFVSPGGYICGEQSALIEAMSDRRAEPRNMPPKLETNGLIDRPTLVSNVETYAWAPYIILNGGEAYAKLGTNGWKGRRFFSISGDVNRPGVYEVPMGMTLRELIYGENYCRGMKGGAALKGFAPSGPSGGFLPAKLTAGAGGLPRDHTNNRTWKELAARRGFDPQAQELDLLDMELELNLFRALSPTQALGAGLVVYGEGRDMAEQAVNSIEFYRNESCGKCVPCRIGSQKFAALGGNLLAGRIDPGTWEAVQPTLGDVGKAMEQASICGLGRSVPVPLRTASAYFAADVSAHLARGAGAPVPGGPPPSTGPGVGGPAPVGAGAAGGGSPGGGVPVGSPRG